MKWTMVLLALVASTGDTARVVIEQVNMAGKCKRWCKTQQTGFPFPSMEELKRLANEKCTQDSCEGCTGGGPTVPDCQDKVMVPEAIKVPDVQVVEAETGVPVCTEGKDFTSQVCSFGQGKICSHIDGAWCAYPSQNPGAQFRLGKKPLCCFDESDSNMDDAETKVAEVVKIMTNDPATTGKDEVQPPVPQCAVDQTFSVDSFKRKDKTVNVCRSSTGRFAKKVCCDPAAFALLESQQRAQEVCETVQDKYCKPDGLGTKRNKAEGIPDTHGCKRMYVCVERGEESYGPFPSPAWCKAEKTGLDRDRSAHKACFAYRIA